MPHDFDPAYRDHDHAACIEEAMAAARQLCAAAGARLTPLREKVLLLIWQSHQPLGAYTILDQLGQTESGRRPAPPTVYRALEFLLELGLVHRLNSLNAYVGCSDPRHAHAGQFLICRQCNTAMELDNDAIDQALDQAARAAGFSAEHAAVEILGLCPNCQQAEKGTARD